MKSGKNLVHMKICIIFIICLLTYPGLAQTPFRFDAETGVSALRLPQPYRTGWHIRQQLTAYVRPRLGVSLGVGWGGSANNEPLEKNLPHSARPNASAILDYYNRQERMTDLTLVALPVLSRRHQLKVQAGLSLQRRREINIDSLFYEVPGNPVYNALPTYTDQRRVMPMVAAGYDFRLSPRWAVGVNAAAYLPADERPITTLGIRTSYRFNVSRDSLGIGPGLGEPLRWGVRLAVNRVGQNGGSSAANQDVTRWVGGLWADYPLSLTWAMRGELNYARRGHRLDGTTSFGFLFNTIRIDATYLELPLLFRHEAAERWNLYAGPYLAFLLAGTSQQDGNPRQSIQPHTNSGFALGAEYEFVKNLSLDLRYQRDVFQISSTPYSSSFHSYQLGLSWAVR